MNKLIYWITNSLYTWRSKYSIAITVVITMGIALSALIFIISINYTTYFKGVPHLIEADTLITKSLSNSHLGVIRALYINQHQNHLKHQSIMVYKKGLTSNGDMYVNRQMVFVTPNLGKLFNIPMAYGRFFNDNENLDGTENHAVISYETWLRKFNGDPNILSKTFFAYEKHYKVIGVIEQDFIEPELHLHAEHTGIWMPLHCLDDYEEKLERREFPYEHDIYLLGVPEKGKTRNDVEKHIENLIIKSDSRYQGESLEIKPAVKFQKIKGHIRDSRIALLVLLNLGVIGAFFIAAFYTISILINHGIERKKVIAIHSAVGASDKDTMSILTTDITLLMLASLGIGILIGNLFLEITSLHFGVIIPRTTELKTSIFSLAPAIIVALLFIVTFPRVFLHYQSKSHISDHLQGSGKGVLHTNPTVYLKSLFTFQITLSLILIILGIRFW